MKTQTHRNFKDEYNRYLEDEYNRLVRLLDSNPDWLTPHEAIQNTLQRCLGVGEFVQALGVAFEEVEPAYEALREKCYELYNRG